MIILKQTRAPSSSMPSSSNERNNKSNNDASAESFRNYIKEALDSRKTFIVTSFNRKILSQTHTGKFSPAAAHDEDNDLVLVLGVAILKHTPHWVKIDKSYHAMLCSDSATSFLRGWVSSFKNKR